MNGHCIHVSNYVLTDISDEAQTRILLDLDEFGSGGKMPREYD